MIITLVIQGVALALFVYYVVFRATGRNYESAALTAGFMGFGMGAIPNAVANLEAITKEFGPAPMAYFLIPLVGGVFTDLINVAILTVMLNVL
jgi:ESS family glutamate:Na+ symporter